MIFVTVCLVGNFVDYGCIVNDWDFLVWVIKLGHDALHT